jgi:hypothetical protein
LNLVITPVLYVIVKSLEGHPGRRAGADGHAQAVLADEKQPTNA